jgi:hypothetical protein
MRAISNAFIRVRNKVRRMRRNLFSSKRMSTRRVRDVLATSTQNNCQGENGALEDIIKALNCPICLEMATNPHIVKPCDHVFCGDCIALWQGLNHQSCPVCKCKIQGHSPSRVLREVVLKVMLLEASQSVENITGQGPEVNEGSSSPAGNDCTLQSISDEVICCWIMQGKPVL